MRLERLEDAHVCRVTATTESPPGCLGHPKGETINLVVPAQTNTTPTSGEGAFCVPPGGGQGMIVVEGAEGPDPGLPQCVETP